MPKGMDMKSLSKEAQKIEARIAEPQSEAGHLTVEQTADGGAVRVLVSGSLRVKELHIREDAFHSGDVKILQDMILAAGNRALDAAETRAGEEMDKPTGGMFSQLKL